MNRKYQNCKLLTCIVSGGIFEKDKVYPFCHISGFAYILLIDTVNRQPVLYVMDAYDDGTYKIVGTFDDWENAKFKEVI
jgi:hypothetical protein